MSNNNDYNGNAKILVVDDDFDISTLIKMVLQKQGYDVSGFTDPLLALEHFRINYETCSLVISDLRMPYMNGFEFCEKILQLDVNIMVCFMSSAEVNIQALRDVYPKARSIGCFIKKPVTISHLVKRLSAELD